MVQGKASISKESIHAEGKAIIHWDTFNIDPKERISFTQSDPKMGILNRVTGGSPSHILGRLEANCPLYLINGKGVFIGQGAHVKTGGFIASTADISNESFLSQSGLAFHDLQEGEIVNLGTISCRKGDVTLIARSIKNGGMIEAPCGQVIFSTTELVLYPNEKKQVFIRPDTLDTQEGIENTGKIEGRSIRLETSSPYAHAINHTGTVKAFATRQENGSIFLIAHEGNIQVNGELNAPAGTIEVRAQNILVQSEGVLDTSSRSQGGLITLKGVQGVHVHEGARLFANSLSKGNGGEISIWSEKETLFAGEAEARGGPLKGDGGRIELSTPGENYRVTGKVDVEAKNGKSGEITFDPKFVIIQKDGTDSATGNTFSSDSAGAATISGSTLQSALNSGNVTIQANTDITFEDSVNATSGNGLTLQAGRSIEFAGELTLNGGNFAAVINDEGAISADRDSGIATFSMYGLGFPSSKLSTQGGNVTINVGTFGGTQEGEIFLSGGHIDAGGGNITLIGFGRLDGSDGASGITVSDYTQVKTSGAGTITFQGTGGNGVKGNHGVYLSDNTTLTQSENGRIYVSGVGGGDGSGSMNSGIVLAGGVESTGSGPIDLYGRATGGVNLNTGVCFISGGVAKVTDGQLTLNGEGKGTGDQNYGIRFESASSCSSSGTGSIKLIGSTSGGVNNNHGVILSNGFIESNNGAISIQGTGQGTGDYNYGFRLETMGAITSTGTASVNIQGNNQGGVMGNIGVSISSDPMAIESVNGNITITGSSLGTDSFNEGFRLDGGCICSTGTGAGAAAISITGTGSLYGTKMCPGVDIGGYLVQVTSIDGDITIHGIASADNDPYTVYPSDAVYTTGLGKITYIEN